MNLIADIFRLLADSARLRILRLLARERLNVSELTGILGMAQSGVSRHLRMLKEGGLVIERREGGWAYYKVEPQAFQEDLRKFWPALEAQIESGNGYREDDARLEEILRQRKEDFREGRPQGINPGRSWSAWARTLSFLVPQNTVADLGAGEGYLTLEVARWAKKVVAVDHSREMLVKGKTLAKKQRVKNIRWKFGKLEALPLADKSFDVALLAQVLHTVQDPLIVLREAHRILVPGGTLLIQELRSHDEEWVREKLGDVWLGFESKELEQMLKESKFKKIRIEIGAKRRGDPFTVLVGAGRK